MSRPTASSGMAPELLSFREAQKRIMSAWLRALVAARGSVELREEYSDEIERAVKNVKRSLFEKWFRRAWWRANGRRKGGGRG